MNESNKYKTPVTYKDIEDKDFLLESTQSLKYIDEIVLYKKTAELYLSLFPNARRLYREVDKVDYIQLLAVRIFHDTRAALILSNRGLYPQASALLRGVLDSFNLIYDFKINPENEDLWFNAGKNKRDVMFKAGAVRKRVEESGVNKSSEGSKNLYNLLSNYSVHTNMESHLWYLETRDKTLLYHWAGYDGGKRSETLVLSVLQSLAQGLFILVYEDIYALDRSWTEDFKLWKKDFLVSTKKFGGIFGDTEVLDLEVLEDKEIIVNF